MNEQDHIMNKSGSMDPGKIGDAIERIGDDRKDRVLSDFQGFKKFLSKRIEMGQNIGLNEEQIAKAAEKVADYLAKHEEPKNSEEKLLQELWKVGKKEERHTLAHMLVRLAQTE